MRNNLQPQSNRYSQIRLILGGLLAVLVFALIIQFTSWIFLVDLLTLIALFLILISLIGTIVWVLIKWYNLIRHLKPNPAIMHPLKRALVTTLISGFILFLIAVYVPHNFNLHAFHLQPIYNILYIISYTLIISGLTAITILELICGFATLHPDNSPEDILRELWFTFLYLFGIGLFLYLINPIIF